MYSGHWTTFIFKQYSIQRRNDETRLVLEASGDFLLEEEDAPVTILEEVQDAEMEVDFSNSTFFLQFRISGGADGRVGGVGDRLHPSFAN